MCTSLVSLFIPRHPCLFLASPPKLAPSDVRQNECNQTSPLNTKAIPEILFAYHDLSPAADGLIQGIIVGDHASFGHTTFFPGSKLGVRLLFIGP